MSAREGRHRPPERFRVIQIIPAEGWYAVHREWDDRDPERRGALPLACWALVDTEDGFRFVVGLEVTDDETGVDSAEEMRNFERYAHRSHLPWMCRVCHALETCEHRASPEAP